MLKDTSQNVNTPFLIINDYMANFYYVIVTFTTVGYGDISIWNTFTSYTYSINNIPTNNLSSNRILFFVQYLMEFLGICVFGYFIGTMRQNLAVDEQNIIRQTKEIINIWITKLRKTTQDVTENNQILLKTREFLFEYWIKNPSLVMKFSFYEDLPTCLRRSVMGTILNSHRTNFAIFFDNTEASFYIDFLKNTLVK